MKKLLAVLIAAVLAFVAFSVVTYAYTDVEVEDVGYYQRFKGKGVKLYVYNWGEYISDGSEDSLDLNKAFEELTGIEVVYSTFASNEEMYAKLRGGGVDYDIIIPSDYMISRMIKEGMLEKLDMDNIPNIKYIDERYLGSEFDPDAEYSVPYTWGMVGIVYDSTRIDPEEVTSWSILWDERFAGNILMFDNSRDAFMIAQSVLGYSYNTEDPDELREVTELLQNQNPILQDYVMDQIFDKMEGGEAILAPYYAGDALVMLDENPDLGFAFPEEGTNLFIDALCIPAGSKHKEAAEMYINFMCEPEVALATADFIGYSTPNSAAYELLDDEVRENPIAYPSEEVIANTEVYRNLSDETNLLLDDLWTQVKTEGSSPWVMPVLLLVAILAAIAINVVRKFRKSKQVF